MVCGLVGTTLAVSLGTEKAFSELNNGVSPARSVEEQGRRRLTVAAAVSCW